MLSRVKQVIAALTAKVNFSDQVFVSKRLNDKERKLFYGMNLPDQRHALNVAYTSLNLSRNNPESDLNLLVRAALLHDVGKQLGDVSTLDKIITVIAHQLVPELASKWGREGRGGKIANFRHAVYVHFHHPERSAQLLRAIGAEPKLVDIISRHHAESQLSDAIELKLLRQADDLN
ncbi:MAG: hypothetical protein H6Q74_699 [Firmicutes bacterium]|nr:hypothetical protein [Bacillota bacterium]